MTDITDQDIETAREFIAHVRKYRAITGPNAVTAVRVLEALLPTTAPAPSLAEELARIAENSPVWTIQNVCDELKSAAARAEQIEQERDEARADVKRLTAEAAEMNAATAASEENVAPDQQANMQGILAGSLPNPADVKPGEAWIVECRGERRTAVKDNDAEVPWSTVNANGWFDSEENEAITLITRLVPAPRVITNPDELERLAATSIIRDGRGWPGGITDQGVTMINGFCVSDEEVLGHGPVTVLWEPATP